jgi:Zn-finger nucleic acid-binding protein
MPLLTSPIDGSPMEQTHRFGIEIDRCKTSGGIWLDKGELEKLMALLKEEAMNDQPVPQRQGQRMPQSYGRYNDDHDDDDDHYSRGHRKKGKMSRMMDIFDF